MNTFHERHFLSVYSFEISTGPIFGQDLRFSCVVTVVEEEQVEMKFILLFN